MLQEVRVTMPLIRKTSRECLDVADEHVTVSPPRAPRLSLDEAQNSGRRAGSGVCSTLCGWCDVSVHPDTIDLYSRVLFPVIFLLFNVIYWMVYKYISSIDHFHTDGDGEL